jgi:hypothetical protein
MYLAEAHHSASLRRTLVHPFGGYGVYTTRCYGKKLTTECTKEEPQRKTRGEIFVFSVKTPVFLCG